MQPRLYFTSAVATLVASAAAWPAMSAQTERSSCQIIDSFRDFIDLAAVVANASADRVACELAKRHPLAELAHLEGPALRKEIGDALAKLQP
jgi:hypothetical protein